MVVDNMTPVRESVVSMEVEGNRMLGVLSHADLAGDTGVIIAVGGPQYRVGAHRQFVQMARSLAQAGIPAMRFDFVGMGDSDGNWDSFERVGQDIVAAIDEFAAANPDVTKFILMGLCDAASAIMMNCDRDNRIAGLILLNPWARTEEGEARAFISHYYGGRLLQASFWRKVASGEFRLFKSLKELLSAMRRSQNTSNVETQMGSAHFIDTMLSALQRYTGPVLFLLSENDLTAREFLNLASESKAWAKVLGGRCTCKIDIPAADHTMSHSDDLNTCSSAAINWILEIS